MTGGNNYTMVAVLLVGIPCDIKCQVCSAIPDSMFVRMCDAIGKKQIDNMKISIRIKHNIILPVPTTGLPKALRDQVNVIMHVKDP